MNTTQNTKTCKKPNKITLRQLSKVKTNSFIKFKFTTRNC